MPVIIMQIVLAVLIALVPLCSRAEAPKPGVKVTISSRIAKASTLTREECLERVKSNRMSKDLRGAKLNDADLRNAMLISADLGEANLKKNQS